MLCTKNVCRLAYIFAMYVSVRLSSTLPKAGFMTDIASSVWRTTYTSALLETDGPKLAIRIAEASAAIKERLNSPIEIEKLEHEAIEAARLRLGNLKAEHVDTVRPRPTEGNTLV